MRIAYVFALVLALDVALGCTEQKSGYCTGDPECGAGLHCQLGPGVNRFTCVANGDGGPGGDGGPDGGDGGGCQKSEQCPSAAPICVSGTCSSCAGADANACAMRDSMHPVCTAGGVCVECSTSADCSGPKPICDIATNTCGPCTSDAQCSGKGIGPGICMAHQDGRCATDAETVYVQFTSACNMTPGGGDGSPGNPLCGISSAAQAVTATRRVLSISGSVPGTSLAIQGASVGGAQLSFIGRTSGTIGQAGGGSAPNLTIDGANVYLRDLSISLSADAGMSVKNAATIQLDTVLFDNNAKGGLLVDTSSFDVRNCTFTNNGPGTASGGVVWGGIRVQGTAPATKSLTDVTVVSNKQVGLSCGWPVDNSGVYASANTGGVDVSPTCGITPCATPGSGCGAM